MGSLRDQFRKANLLSQKDARRLAHEERVERKQKGRVGLEAEKAEREAELRRARDEERDRDRERQAARDAERRAAEERAACEAILETEARAPSGGNVPWLFELADGRIPMLRLSDHERHELEGGRSCLVRTQDGDAHTYALLSTEHARRVAAQRADRVVWSAPGALTG